jgi:aryl-alcohol dehydrogenase-like predicted oxidoreductase
VPYRTLGGSLDVSAIGLGCMGMSSSYGPSDDSESIRTIHRALDLGVTLIDTAPGYGPFTNEVLVGKAIAGRRRESVVLATKFGNEPAQDGTKRVDGRPDYVRAACDASLTRLGVDVIDLYYQHRVDPSVPVEETWGAIHELVLAGKVKYAGICEAAPATIRRAHSAHPVTAVQTEWSLWSRDPEINGVLATTRELGIGFVPYSPLGRGMLTGAFRSPDDLAADDWRRVTPRFQGDNFRRNRALVETLTGIAHEMSVSTAQLALAWVLAQGEDVVPIPGTRRVDRLEENLDALTLVLTPEVMDQIDQALPVGAASGDRYPDMSALHL